MTMERRIFQNKSGFEVSAVKKFTAIGAVAVLGIMAVSCAGNCPCPCPVQAPLDEPAAGTRKNLRPDEQAKVDYELLASASSGDFAGVKRALKNGANVNYISALGRIPLLEAIAYKSIVELLIEKGADVNAMDSVGYTALMSSSLLGRKEVAELLIAKGADVNARDKKGMTALMWASEYGQKDVAELLIAKGADVNARDESGWTALIVASYQGHFDFVELLIGKGADINARTFDDAGMTALRGARRAWRPGIIELLKQHGARE